MLDALPRQQALPHSEESERAVLAALLLDARLLPVVSGRLRCEDFYLERHRHLYGAMVDLAAEGVDVDLRTLQAKLEQRGRFDGAGGLAYLATLELDLPDLGNVGAYVEIVKDRSARRQVIQAAAAAMREALTGDEPTVAPLVGRLQSALTDVLSGATRRRLEPIGVAVDALLEQVEQGGAKALVGLPTGFPELDRFTHGLVRGNLIVPAGRTSMGKTTWAFQVARFLALEEQRRVAMFSLEMTLEELAFKALVAEADVPDDLLRAGDLSRAQWSRLIAAVRRLAAAPLYLDCKLATIPEIAAAAHQMRSEVGLDVLILDYLQLVKSHGSGRRYENRNLEVGAFARQLKQLAGELDIPVLALSQLSRDVVRRGGDHRPILADLRDSGQIEEHADVVVFIHRPEYYEPTNPDVRGIAELMAAKVRNGRTGTVTLGFSGEAGKFMPRAQVQATPPPPQPSVWQAAVPGGREPDPF